MKRLSEAEQSFFEDVREKKKAAMGVHSKTGKNGYTGKILFAYDVMSRKEKYNHRKAGKIMTTNLFAEVITLEEFDLLEIHEKKNRMQYWRSEFGIKEIQSGLGISNKKFYDIIDELNLPKRMTTGGRKKRIAPLKASKATATAIEVKEELTPAPVQEIIIHGLHFGYNGTFGAEQIQKQLTKFMAMLEGETSEFYIELKLMEKTGKKEGLN